MNDQAQTQAQLLAALAEARQTIARLEATLAGRLDWPGPSLPAAFAEALGNSLPGILYLFDLHAHLLWWNPQLERVTGYSAAELAGAPLARFVPAETLPRVRQRFQAVLATGAAELEAPLVLK